MSSSETEVVLTVRIVPRASRSEIVGMVDGVLKIRIAAPPVDGAANAELIKLLARAFAVAKSDVEFISGESGKTKILRILGPDPARIDDLLKAKT
jgi:uncharacterized protein